MTRKHDFRKKSIKCDTWEQMEHLEQLAKKQGYKKFCQFDINSFDRGETYFTVDHNDYMMINKMYDPIEISYTKFITSTLPPLPTEVVEVTGCDGCPFDTNLPLMSKWCSHPNHENKGYALFDACPLKKSSLTIQLKQHEPTGN